MVKKHTFYSVKRELREIKSVNPADNSVTHLLSFNGIVGNIDNEMMKGYIYNLYISEMKNYKLPMELNAREIIVT